MPLTITQLEDKYFDPALGLTRYYGDVEVIPHVDGVAYFNAIADALDTCQGPGDKIYITSWVFWGGFDLRLPRSQIYSTSPTPGMPLGKILVDKAALGVDVRLIFGSPYYSTGLCGSALDGDMIFNGVVAAADSDTLIGQAGIRDVVETNIDQARKLRDSERGAPSSRPLEGRVLLDWGGTWPDSRHDKTVVVYSSSTKQLRAFVAGIDLEPHRISDPTHSDHSSADDGDFYSWHDAGVELYGSAAQGVLDNFITRWVETATLPPRSHLCNNRIEFFNPAIVSTAPSRPIGAVHPSTPSGASVRVLRSYEDLRVSLWSLKGFPPMPVQATVLPWSSLTSVPVLEIQSVLTRAISRAERYIYIECQTLNSPNDFTSIYYKHDDLFPPIAAACARGVKVILVCRDMTLAPVMADEIRNKILAPLTAAQRDNFCLYRLNGCYLHSKVVIVDDEFVTIGAANMWDRSTRGWETELNAAYVHPGESNSMGADLRVRLWLEHLRIDPSNSVAASELRDLGSGLGVFRRSWATTSLSFAYPGSMLQEIVP